MSQDEPKLLVDFNNDDDDDVIVALRKHATGPDPYIGQPRILHDREGNSALGYVTATDDRTISVRVAWDTWREPVVVTQDTTPAVDLMAALRQSVQASRETKQRGDTIVEFPAKISK